MEEKIQKRMKNAYEGIVLEDGLKNKAKENLLAKSHNAGEMRISYGIMAAAAVIALFLIVNVLIIGLNFLHDRKTIPGDEVTSYTEESINDVTEEYTERYSEAFMDFDKIENRLDLEKLKKQPNAYSIKLRNDMYFIVLAYNGDEHTESYSDAADRIDVGCYVTENDEIAGYDVQTFSVKDNDFSLIGVSNYNGSYYLVCKEKDSERYKITGLLWDYSEELYCNEGICSDVRSHVQGFAVYSPDSGQSASEYPDGFWKVGYKWESDIKRDPKSYCSEHDWDEICAKDMTVRDIYVTRNWIGGSAADYISLEGFFNEFALTGMENGIAMSENPSEGAYQVNIRYAAAGFQVSTEVDSDEIISVTLYQDCYVTEDVRLGMDMEEVKRIMDIDDDAFFELDGTLFSFFERDGYLYEFSYNYTGTGGQRVLGMSCISDAGKIKDSTVKSFGEKIGEGSNIFAQ